MATVRDIMRKVNEISDVICAVDRLDDKAMNVNLKEEIRDFLGEYIDILESMPVKV